MLRLPSDTKLPPVEVLQSTGWTLELRVDGRSMEPVIMSGGRVTVQCGTPDQLKPGDIVCFRDGDHFVLHRLLERTGSDERCFFEKGDAETSGRWIAGSSILGKLTAVNDQPVNEEAARVLLEQSRKERDVVQWARERGILPRHVFWGRLWRAFKRIGRRRLREQGG